MEILSNLWWFIVVLGVLIFFHEFGHFITAKAFGIRVFIFSFGFGKRLLGFKWGDTDCRVSLIPLGGYVKLEGEPDDQLSEDTSHQGDGRDFTSRPRWQRILVYLAGPAANVLLTAAVMTGLYMVGVYVPESFEQQPVIGAVEPGSPAAAAGIQPGDRILEIDGEPQENWEDALFSILIRPDADVSLSVDRAGRELDFTLRSLAVGKEKAGSIGVSPLVRIGRVRAGSAAEQAGLQPDDAILRIEGESIHNFGDIVPLIAASEGREIALSVYREGRTFDVRATPRDAGSGFVLGIESKLVLKQYGLARALVEGASSTWTMTQQVVTSLQRLLTARLSPKSMMGPIGIAGASGEAARQGPRSLGMLIAMISLSVGILNLFPMPPLDGGHLAILIGESVVRRDFSLNVKIWVANAGAIALLVLIAFVLYSDASKTSLLGPYLP
jgi:regulator of sigma E protease